MFGFVYIWRDRYRKMYYVGSHIGNLNDGYVASSTTFKRAYRKRPEDFKRRILEISCDNWEDLRKAEDRWLKMMKPEEIGKRYYNFNRAARGPDSETAKIPHRLKNSEGKSVHAVRIAVLSHLIKNEEGKSALGARNGNLVHLIKNEEGKSVHAVKCGETTKLRIDEDGKNIPGKQLTTWNLAHKDENGKIISAVKGGKVGGPISGKIVGPRVMRALHSEKNEEGKSIFALEMAARAQAKGYHQKGIMPPHLLGVAEKLHSRKDESGKSALAVKMGKAGGPKGGPIGMHNRWHINRGISNPNCPLCQKEKHDV